MRCQRFLTISRWLLPVLVVFALLGHACEWDSVVDLAAASHATHDDHHRASHADGPQVSCEGLEGTASTGSMPRHLGVDRARVLPDVMPVVVRLVAFSPADREDVPTRPPLFLLHASLLI